MQQLSAQLASGFQRRLRQAHVPQALHLHYQKGAGRYIYFCQKYDFPPTAPNRVGALSDQTPRQGLLHRAASFRHTYASHLLLADFDLQTIQRLLGHTDIKTTMIYLQTVPTLTLKQAKSPLDCS